jgi:hypothetical protein
LTAYRLTVKSEDEVQAEKIWDLGRKSSPGYEGQVATPELLYPTCDKAVVVEAETGKVLLEGNKWNRIGELSNILAGDLFIWADQGRRDRLMSLWGRRRAIDGKTALEFHAADVSNPVEPKRLKTTNVLGGDNIPHFPPFEKYLAELYDARALWGSWNGLPSHFMHTDTGIYPHGDRLFIRSVSHLYCIGDADNPWHTPAGAPPQARTGK